MLVYGYNGFPGKRVPEILIKLMICWRFKGGLSYSDLTDRPESGELFEIAATFVQAMNKAEKMQADRAKAQARQ